MRFLSLRRSAIRPRYVLTITLLTAVSVGRLVVQLPDKYPGQDLAFAARVGSANAAFSIVRRARWPLELSIDAGRTWSYQSTARLTRDLLGARVTIGHHVSVHRE